MNNSDYILLKYKFFNEYKRLYKNKGKYLKLKQNTQEFYTIEFNFFSSPIFPAKSIDEFSWSRIAHSNADIFADKQLQCQRSLYSPRNLLMCLS